MSEVRHATTRRGFIAALGFGGVSLYALWAAYGAAPGPRALLGRTASETSDEHGLGGHGGGHADVSGGASPEEFRRMVEEFVERYRLEDGSVYPRRAGDSASAVIAGNAHAGHGGHAAAEAPDHGEGEGSGAVQVLILAERWYYEPAHLRLDAGVPYRFRMMATDVSHGASIQFGRGGRMIRLRPGAVAEMEAVFERPGSFLVYCTVYCGPAHDYMQARIDVV